MSIMNIETELDPPLQRRVRAELPTEAICWIGRSSRRLHFSDALNRGCLAIVVPGGIIFAVETHRDDEGIEHQSEHGFLYLSDVSAAERGIEKIFAATAGLDARRDADGAGGGNSSP